MRVCAAEELAPGQRKLVSHRDRKIGVFNVDGRYFVLANRCPHKGAPLCRAGYGRW